MILVAYVHSIKFSILYLCFALLWLPLDCSAQILLASFVLAMRCLYLQREKITCYWQAFQSALLSDSKIVNS